MRTAVQEQLKRLTKYERARLIAARALQIAQGAPFKINLTKEQLEKIRYNPIEIAKLELEAGVIPLVVKRPEPKRVEELEEGEIKKI